MAHSRKSQVVHLASERDLIKAEKRVKGSRLAKIQCYH